MSSDTPGPDLTDLGYTYLAPPDAEMEFDDIETPSDAEGIEALYELIGRNARHMLASSPYFQGNSRGYSFYLVPPDAPPAPGGEGVWVAVSGNDLPGIIRVRLAKSRAGAIKVTALVLGDEGTSELTSESLRAVRLADIVQALLERFREGPPPFPDDAARDASGTIDDKIRVFTDSRDLYEAYWIFKELVFDAAPETSSAVSEHDELAQFARVYARNLREQPRRAMSATAEELTISRATANRRAADARKRGLLPPREKD